MPLRRRAHMKRRSVRIGANPRAATSAGYVVSLNSITDPAAIRVRHAVHGTVLLTHDGLVRGCE